MTQSKGPMDPWVEKKPISYIVDIIIIIWSTTILHQSLDGLRRMSREGIRDETNRNTRLASLCVREIMRCIAICMGHTCHNTFSVTIYHHIAKSSAAFGTTAIRFPIANAMNVQQSRLDCQ